MRHLLIAALALSPMIAAAAQPAPPIEINYDEQADERCSTGARQPIKTEWAAELNAKLPEYRALWSTVGPAMISAVTKLTNKPFSPPKTVRLTLCDTPSNAFFEPTVNMRFSLQSFVKTPVPLRYKVDTAFHEMLHAFVGQSLPLRSPLLTQHAAESACVRNHLHLLALQKAVLLSLDDKPALEQVIAIDSQLPSGCYKRAWAIVNRTDDAYNAFVAELRR